MTALQERGVPAGVCQTAEDRCEHDPQIGMDNDQIEALRPEGIV
jgi:hypothetical protein